MFPVSWGWKYFLAMASEKCIRHQQTLVEKSRADFDFKIYRTLNENFCSVENLFL